MDWQRILFGLIFGLIVGTVVGLFNFWIIWRASRTQEGEDGRKSTNRLLARLLLRYVLDIATMVVLFLFHDKYPFSYEYVLVGGATGLVVPGRILSLKKGLAKRGKNNYGT